LLINQTKNIYTKLPILLGMDWDAWRSEFPILQHKTYLNSCSLGPISTRVKKALKRYIEIWEMEELPWDETPWDTWMKSIEDVRVEFARLINAKSKEIAVTFCASTALSSIASALDYRNKNEILVTDMDFPTNYYVWKAHEKHGARTRLIRSKDGISIPINEFEKVINKNTLMVSTSHVFSFSGFMQDLHALSDICRERDVLLAVDAYQSAGTIPIDVRDVQIDILISGSVKWLLGGPGIAFLYVREDLIEEFKPSCTGWLASQNPFEFKSDTFIYSSTASRFQLGTPPVPNAYAAKAGIELIREVKPDKIRKRTIDLTQNIIEKAQTANIEIRSPLNPDERGSIVILRVPSAYESYKTLIAKGIITSYRAGGIRIAPHFFNNEEDIERLFQIISGG